MNKIKWLCLALPEEDNRPGLVNFARLADGRTATGDGFRIHIAGVNGGTQEVVTDSKPFKISELFQSKLDEFNNIPDVYYVPLIDFLGVTRGKHYCVAIEIIRGTVFCTKVDKISGFKSNMAAKYTLFIDRKYLADAVAGMKGEVSLKIINKTCILLESHTNSAIIMAMNDIRELGGNNG